MFVTLIKVLKENNLWPKFRASLAVTPFSGKNGISSIYYDLRPFERITRNCGDNPFSMCFTTKELLERMDSYIQRPPFKFEDYYQKTQFYIIESINTLLHNCLERSIMRRNSSEGMKILEKIGGETFDMVCKKLFGEGYEDKTANLVQPPHYGEMPTMEDILGAMNSIPQLSEYLKSVASNGGYVTYEDIRNIMSQYQPNQTPTEIWHENDDIYCDWEADDEWFEQR